MSDDQEKSALELQIRLVLNELKSVHKRLDTMETQLEDKIDRLSEMFRADHKELESEVTDLKIKIAVLTKDVNLKTTGIAIACSGFIAVISAAIQYMKY